MSSFDFLTGIDDFLRMGGFRFKEEKKGDFINVDESLKIPPLADVRELIAASMEIEKSEEENQLPSKKWINQLVISSNKHTFPPLKFIEFTLLINFSLIDRLAADNPYS